MPRAFPPQYAHAYAELWADLGITHALTISLGTSPTIFRPEEDLMPVLRALLREGAHRIRRFPSRKLRQLTVADPHSIMLAGFYEATKRCGTSFPHWHGGVALYPGEEHRFRDLLWRCIGEDADHPLGPSEPSRTTHPLIKGGGSKATFHLAPIQTSERYIRYANKNHSLDDVVHWTSADLLTA